MRCPANQLVWVWDRVTFREYSRTVRRYQIAHWHRFDHKWGGGKNLHLPSRFVFVVPSSWFISASETWHKVVLYRLAEISEVQVSWSQWRTVRYRLPKCFRVFLNFKHNPQCGFSKAFRKVQSRVKIFLLRTMMWEFCGVGAAGYRV